MANISREDLLKAKKFIDGAGAAKNPISLVMELGQLLHIAPDFVVYEPADVSSIHQHVFACEARFANYVENVQGYNKKRVKTAAADKMIDRIAREAGSTAFQNTAVSRTILTDKAVPSQTPGVRWQREALRLSPVEPLEETEEPIESIGNAVGKLQEQAMAMQFGLPDYTTKEVSFDGIQKQFITTVKLPRQQGHCSASSFKKPEAKQRAAHKMLNTILQSSAHTPSFENVKLSEDRLSTRTMRSYFKNMQMQRQGMRAEEVGDGSFDNFVDIFTGIDLNRGDGKQSKQTSVEKLEKIVVLEEFEIKYHDIKSTSESYLCLLQAKIGPSLVCHGIGENQPQAREKAAENMLQIIRFFKHYNKETK